MIRCSVFDPFLCRSRSTGQCSVRCHIKVGFWRWDSNYKAMIFHLSATKCSIGSLWYQQKTPCQQEESDEVTFSQPLCLLCNRIDIFPSFGMIFSFIPHHFKLKQSKEHFSLLQIMFWKYFLLVLWLQKSK